MSEITLTVSLTMYPRELVKHLVNERDLKVQDLGRGIYYVEGEIVPVQILESKRLSPVDNLFLRNLRSNLDQEDLLNTLKSYKAQKPINEKNAYLDRLVSANSNALKEAMRMSEATWNSFLEDAEKSGLLENRLEQERKKASIKAAKKMLQDGELVEKVAKWTDLSIEEVLNLQQHSLRTF